MRSVELIVGEQIYAGWKRVNITRSIEQIAGTFELSVSERKAAGDYDPEDSLQRELQDGAECTVLIEGEPVITGYVDDIMPEYDTERHEITVQGRDRTADLVDCSAQYKSGEWKNASLEKIAMDLCDPYDIKVIAEVSTERFLKFSLNKGESIFETLDRAAKMRGVLLMSDGLGNLVITRAGVGRIDTPLIYGVNILRARATRSQRDRYKTYTIIGQRAGLDSTGPSDNSGPKFTATDTYVGRRRTLIVLAEEQSDIATCKRRAIWEMNNRAGRSRLATVTVQGWRHDAGLWEPNKLVAVRDELLGIEDDLLIVSVQYSLSPDDGTTTELTLARREGYDVLKLPEKSEGGF